MSDPKHARHIDDNAGGHEMVVTHDDDIAIYTAVCLNGDGADCRLVCSEGCEEWPAITRDSGGAFHGVYSHDGSLVDRHRMLDAGECQAVLWFEQDPGATPELAEDRTDRFEIGRFPIHLVQTEYGIKWQRRKWAATHETPFWCICDTDTTTPSEKP